MAKLVLDMTAVEDEFFSDTALIGIVSALPGYRFCWMINQYFGYNFVRDAEADVLYKKKKGVPTYFSLYQYQMEDCATKYLLYQLKVDKETLMPEIKQLDYLWLIHSQDAVNEANSIVNHLREVGEIQLAQVLSAEKLKSVNHLLL